MATKQGIVTIGIDVKIGDVSLKYVTDIGDIGGTPEMLDATCMQDTMTHNAPGVKKQDDFAVTCWYDNSDPESDFREMKAFEAAGESKEVVVTFPDGTKATSSGRVSNRVTGLQVNNLIRHVISLSLDADWAWTDPVA